MEPTGQRNMSIPTWWPPDGRVLEDEIFRKTVIRNGVICIRSLEFRTSYKLEKAIREFEVPFTYVLEWTGFTYVWCRRNGRLISLGERNLGFKNAFFFAKVLLEGRPT